MTNESADGKVLNASKRKECWLARDNFFSCLDQNDDDKVKCLEMSKQFENLCPEIWV